MEHLFEECRRVHAERFAAAQFRIAERYLGCSLPLPDCWMRIDVDVEPLLEDMFAGGVHGASDLTRLHTATVTLNAIRKRPYRRESRHIAQHISDTGVYGGTLSLCGQISIATTSAICYDYF